MVERTGEAEGVSLVGLSAGWQPLAEGTHSELEREGEKRGKGRGEQGEGDRERGTGRGE